MITQEQYLLLQQSIRRHRIRIELLNSNDVIIDSFEGISIGGSINIQAESTYRRSGNVKMVVLNKEFLPSSTSKIWFNRRLRMYVGLENFNDEIVWFNKGVFIIQDVSIDNSPKETIMELSLTDLMGILDGTDNGNLSHEVKIVPEGIKVEEALRSTLSQLGKVSIDKITINDSDALVPYEINMPPTSSIYELLKELIDLYMGLEMFFDEDGFLIVQKIKDRDYDPVLWDFSKDGMNLTIDSSNEFDFTNVRNSIYVWGKKKDSGETIKYSYRNRFFRKKLADLSAISDKLIGDICYIEENNTSYVWEGSWIEMKFAPNFEFCIDKIGEKKFSHVDEKIATNEQAKLRAEYELKLRSSLAERISLTCVPIFGIDVNSKIRLKYESIGIDADYIVKGISLGLSYSDSMSIQAEKIYY